MPTKIKNIRSYLLVFFLMTFVYLSWTEMVRSNIDQLLTTSGTMKYNHLLVYHYAEGLKNPSIQDLQDWTNQTKQLADIFATKIDEIANLLEETSRDPMVRNISYANMISKEFMGISESSDIEKRNVAEYLLGKDHNIGGIYFTLPNGDVYLGEPYSAQEQLHRINFAHRDWYYGVSKTNETYVSSVFISASTRATATAIAVPVYQDDTKNKLVGYWVGIINIEPLWKSIKANYLPADKGLNIIDHEGNEIINSGKYNYTDIQSAPSFLKYGNATKDRDTGTIRILGDDTVAISYPIHLNSHVWTVTTLH